MPGLNLSDPQNALQGRAVKNLASAQPTRLRLFSAVAEQRYIVLDVESARSDDGAFHFGPTADEPPSAVLNIASLTPRAVADERRRPGRVVAEPLPTALIQPVSTSDASAPAEPGCSWGVEAVGAAESRLTGMGITVAVLDTGIDPEHEAFRDLDIAPEDFTGEGLEDKVGHGTHCAGTIAGRDVNGYRFGVAPGIDRLLVGKVLGERGGSTETVSKGILWALDQGANVISMSLGLDFPGLVARWQEEGMAAEPATSRALEGYRDNLRLFESLADFVNAQADRPAIVVAATGNESRREAKVPFTIGVAPPAASKGFIAVGALRQAADGGLSVARFSNSGATVAAPGVDILSAVPGGRYAIKSGTSMATPHVAAVAALWGESLLASTGRLDGLVARLTGTGREIAGIDPADIGTGLVRAPKGG
jgi:subtilisin family serine protease